MLELGASMDSMNNEGWKCKELQKHETMQKVLIPLLNLLGFTWLLYLAV